jgi:hypothetical protein
MIVRVALMTTGVLGTLILTTSAAIARCGTEYSAKPSTSDVPGGPPLAIGDSVLADAVPVLARGGFEADGMVCRQMSQGVELLRARGRTLPHLVVVALGTNGDVTPAEIDSLLEILGPERILALVTPYGSVVPSSPATIRAAAAEHPGRILLLDWDRLAEDHPQWLAADGVHLGSTAGINAFAALIESAYAYASPTATGSSPSGLAGAARPVGPPVTLPRRTKHVDQQGGTGGSAPVANAEPLKSVRIPSARGTNGNSPALTVIIVGTIAALAVLAACAVWMRRY